MQRRSCAGFTLIELLCSMTIILILASLTLGPAMRAYKRAKNLQWENNSIYMLDRVRDRFIQHFGRAAQYPALRVDHLNESGLIDNGMRDFRGDQRVKFHPFSSNSPETVIIVEV